MTEVRHRSVTGLPVRDDVDILHFLFLSVNKGKLRNRKGRRIGRKEE